MAKIAVICDREFFSPFDQRVYKEVISLTKLGHHVEIITPHETTKTKKIDNVKVHCLTTKGPPASTAYRIIKKGLNGNYDLYYCHELDPLLYSLVFKFLRKKPIIWDCHEHLVPMKKELQGKLSALITDIAIKIAAPKVNHIITVDNLLGRKLAKMNRVTVIPNYPTEREFPLKTKQMKNRKPKLLYVGGLTKARGTEVMIRAFNKVKKSTEVELTIVGGFYDKKLEIWARDYDKKNDLEINWLGWINYKELTPIFSDTSLGLCLLQNQERYNKAIATKIYEYLVMGIPVISSKGLFVDRLIERANCGKSVDGTSVDSVAKAIIDLLKGDLQKIGHNGQRFARKRFMWEKREEKLSEIVRELTQINYQI